MVEPVNYQHTLARTQIAEQVQERAKQQNIADEQAFANELTKLERAREKEVQRTDQDKEGVKVREDEQKKRGHAEGEGAEHGGAEHGEAEHGEPEQGKAETPPPASDEEITDDPEHHIDITA